MAKPVWTAERTGRALVKSLLPVRSRLAHKSAKVRLEPVMITQ